MTQCLILICECCTCLDTHCQQPASATLRSGGFLTVLRVSRFLSAKSVQGLDIALHASRFPLHPSSPCCFVDSMWA